MTDEATDEAPKAKKKKAPARKPAATKKPATARAKRPTTKKLKPAEDTLETAPVEAAPAHVEEVIDAEIVAETVIDPEASETVDEGASEAQIELTDEERELSAIYGEE